MEGLHLGTIHFNLIKKIFWLEKRAISNIGKSETHSDKKIGGKRNQVLSQKNVTLDKPEVLIFFYFFLFRLRTRDVMNNMNKVTRVSISFSSVLASHMFRVRLNSR